MVIAPGVGAWRAMPLLPAPPNTKITAWEDFDEKMVSFGNLS